MLYNPNQAQKLWEIANKYLGQAAIWGGASWGAVGAMGGGIYGGVLGVPAGFVTGEMVCIGLAAKVTGTYDIKKAFDELLR